MGMPTPRRRRRTSSTCSTRPSLGVSAALAAACCSTLLLQALTTSASPKATAAALTPASTGLLTALLARVGASSPSSASPNAASADVRTMDLRVANVSVHRVRYVNSELHQQPQSDDRGDDVEEQEEESEAAASGSSNSWWNDSHPESLVGRWTRSLRSLRERKRAAHVTSVVVTWDDHFRDAAGDDGSEDDNDVSSGEGEKKDGVPHALPRSVRSGVEVTYELQHWVSSWGLDGLWHPSNRVVSVAEPFVVLSSLPQEHVIAFRVRMKVKQTSGLLASGWFAAETEGPWSAVALLAPSREDALDAILAFLLSNKTFFLVLLLCIGSGILVICKLFVSHRLAVARRSPSRALAPPPAVPTHALDESTSGSSSNSSHSARSPVGKRNRHGAVASGSDLLQEINDLRQELADSEAEVHKLMVFRGYGMERLAAPELALVEQELRASLQRVQQLRKLQLQASAPGSGGITSSEDDTEGDDGDEPEISHRNASSLGVDRGRECRRRLGVVHESLASESR